MNKFQFSPSHRGHLLSSLESAEILEFQFSPSHRGHLMPGKCNLPSNILFQFSPSHRGHLKEDVTRIDLSIVSILALAQRASIQGPGRAARLGFQFSPSHRGHHRNVTVRCYKSRSFNSRPRTEGITACICPLPCCCSFQFSPSHRGHPQTPRLMYCSPKVSILALAQRASETVQSIRGYARVSILALAQRASLPALPQVQCHLQFQFSPSHRGHRDKSLSGLCRLEFQFSPSHRGHPEAKGHEPLTDFTVKPNLCFS